MNPTKPRKVGLKLAIFSKLSLIENSYNFLNQSLVHYRKAARDVHEWPFALLHITQSIELMLKHVLKGVHPILVFEDVDHPKHSLSLERALIRLEVVGVTLEEKEKINIRKAANYRNEVVHYEFELNRFECKKIYAQLFEFVHFFHMNHLGKEIHAHIEKHHWAVEARLIEYFRKNFVVYNGVEMHRENPRNIIRAQLRTSVSDGLRTYSRIKYGDAEEWPDSDYDYADTPCHDCLVVKGQYHAERCDMERCPKCGGQFFCCPCGW